MSDYTDEQRALDVFFDEGCPNVQEESPKQADPATPAEAPKSKPNLWTWLQSPVKRIALLVVIIAIAAAPVQLQFSAPSSVGISSSPGAAS